MSLTEAHSHEDNRKKQEVCDLIAAVVAAVTASLLHCLPSLPGIDKPILPLSDTVL